MWKGSIDSAGVFETRVQKNFTPFFGPAPTLLATINVFYPLFWTLNRSQCHKISNFVIFESDFHLFLGPNCLGTPQELRNRGEVWKGNPGRVTAAQALSQVSRRALGRP